MHHPKLLDRRPMPPMKGDVPVATHVFLYRLEPWTLEALRQACGAGLGALWLGFHWG
jgi:hypothetical protein